MVVRIRVGVGVALDLVRRVLGRPQEKKRLEKIRIRQEREMQQQLEKEAKVSPGLLALVRALVHRLVCGGAARGTGCDGGGWGRR